MKKLKPTLHLVKIINDWKKYSLMQVLKNYVWYFFYLWNRRTVDVLSNKNDTYKYFYDFIQIEIYTTYV